MFVLLPEHGMDRLDGNVALKVALAGFIKTPTETATVRRADFANR